MLQEIEENRESLVPILLFRALLVLKVTGEMLGGLETRELRDLKEKKDRKELGRLE